MALVDSRNGEHLRLNAMWHDDDDIFSYSDVSVNVNVSQEFLVWLKRLLTVGTVGSAAPAWTTTADGDDLAGLILERVDSDMVVPKWPNCSTLRMPWAPV